MSIVPTAAADNLVSGESSASGNGRTKDDGVRTIPGDQGRSAGGGGVEAARHANNGAQSNSNEVMVGSGNTPQIDEVGKGVDDL